MILSRNRNWQNEMGYLPELAFSLNYSIFYDEIEDNGMSLLPSFPISSATPQT